MAGEAAGRRYVRPGPGTPPTSRPAEPMAGGRYPTDLPRKARSKIAASRTAWDRHCSRPSGAPMPSPGLSPRRLGGARAEAASGHAHRRHRMSLPFTICPGHGGCTRRRDWTAAAAIAVATAAALAVAGCGGGQPTVALPGRATPAVAPAALTSPASSSPALPSPQPERGTARSSPTCRSGPPVTAPNDPAAQPRHERSSPPTPARPTSSS